MLVCSQHANDLHQIVPELRKRQLYAVHHRVSLWARRLCLVGALSSDDIRLAQQGRPHWEYCPDTVKPANGILCKLSAIVHDVLVLRGAREAHEGAKRY
jgi:hypothetical protein